MTHAADDGLGTLRAARVRGMLGQRCCELLGGGAHEGLQTHEVRGRGVRAGAGMDLRSRATMIHGDDEGCSTWATPRQRLLHRGSTGRRRAGLTVSLV